MPGLVPYTNSVLSGVIEKRRPVATPILDRHFTSRRQTGTPYVQLDIVNGVEGLAVSISHGTRSTRAPQSTESSMTVTIPRFSEHDVVKASDLIGLRQAGSMALRAQDQVFTRKLDMIRSRFDRTKEYMAIKGCMGSVVDGGGNVIAEYDVPNRVDVDFLDVSTGSDDPNTVFDDIGTAIARALGGSPGVLRAYCGITAYAAIRNHPSVRELIKNTAAANALLESGQIRAISGVVIEKFIGVYADLNGNDQVFIPDDEILVLSESAGFEMIHGPCETPDGLSPQEWFVDSWQERDPAGQVLRVETNPLPVVTRPEAVRRLRVVS